MGGTRFGEWVGDQELDEWKDDEKYMYHGGGSPWEQLDPRPVQFWRSATDAAYTHPGPRHVDRRALHLDDFAATLAADEAYLLWRRQMPTPLPVAENAERHWEDMRIARQRFPTEPISMERKAYLGVGAEWKARLHWQDSPDTGGWEGRPDTAIPIDYPAAGGDTTVFAGPWIYAPGFADRVQDAHLRD